MPIYSHSVIENFWDACVCRSTISIAQPRQILIGGGLYRDNCVVGIQSLDGHSIDLFRSIGDFDYTYLFLDFSSGINRRFVIQFGVKKGIDKNMV